MFSLVLLNKYWNLRFTLLVKSTINLDNNCLLFSVTPAIRKQKFIRHYYEVLSIGTDYIIFSIMPKKHKDWDSEYKFHTIEPSDALVLLLFSCFSLFPLLICSSSCWVSSLTKFNCNLSTTIENHLKKFTKTVSHLELKIIIRGR